MQVVDLATRAGELHLAKGAADAARQMAEAALRVDPWCDRAHRIAIAAHVGLGDRRATSRALSRYQAALAEVGVRPEECARVVAQVAAALGAAVDT